MRVFIPSIPDNIDLSDLRRHGPVIAIGGDAGVMQPQLSVEQMLAELHRQGFNCHEDSLVLAGRLVPVAMMLAAVSAVYERVNVFIFDARNSKYVHRTIDWSVVDSKTPFSP